MANLTSIILTIICCVIAAGISGGIIYFIMSSNDKTDIQENREEEVSNSNNVEIQKNNSNSQENNSISGSYNSNSSNNNEKKKQYIHVALQGCVITESNSDTGSCTYRKKCESCGNLQPGTTSTYLTSGTMNSSFYCPKCKQTQKIQIETTLSYE